MTNPDTDTVFVTMYDPALGNVQVQAPLLAVPTYQSHGWLLLDPNATPPPVATPFLTQAAGDSRYLRAWLGGETLIAGAVRMTADGHIIVRNSNGTTRSTYDGTEAALWTVVGGGVAAVAGLTGSPTAQQIVTALDTPLKAAIDAEGTRLGWGSGGGGGGLSVTDNGDGTASTTSSSVTDNGDGTALAA